MEIVVQKRVPEILKATQNSTTSLGCLPEFNSKTLFLKTPNTLVTGVGEKAGTDMEVASPGYL